MYVVTIRLTQWGSKELGDQGYSPIEILRYFYGDDIYINTAEEISGIPASWPGYTLEEGSSENAVREFQSVFGLPVTGKVDYPTWYKISEIYVGVSRIAELT